MVSSNECDVGIYFARKNFSCFKSVELTTVYIHIRYIFIVTLLLISARCVDLKPVLYLLSQDIELVKSNHFLSAIDSSSCDY